MAISRRRALKLAGGIAGGIAFAGAGLAWLDRRGNPRTPLRYVFPEPAGAEETLPPTPDCDAADPTEAQTEGPFYRPDTPLRANLREPGVSGTPLVIEGRVLTTDCRPVEGAVLDVWSCDGEGVYDNEGFRLRGHQFTDARGAYRIETVKPGAYRQFLLHRTPHVHVKLQGRGTPLLTTQLYFPGETLNEQDWIFDESLLMKLERSGETLHAAFDFVLRPGSQA